MSSDSSALRCSRAFFSLRPRTQRHYQSFFVVIARKVVLVCSRVGLHLLRSDQFVLGHVFIEGPSAPAPLPPPLPPPRLPPLDRPSPNIADDVAAKRPDDSFQKNSPNFSAFPEFGDNGASSVKGLEAEAPTIAQATPASLITTTTTTATTTSTSLEAGARPKMGFRTSVSPSESASAPRQFAPADEPDGVYCVGLGASTGFGASNDPVGKNNKKKQTPMKIPPLIITDPVGRNSRPRSSLRRQAHLGVRRRRPGQ